jgi:hypothetical protein
MKPKQKNKIPSFIDFVIIYIITNTKNKIYQVLNSKKRD